VTSLEQKKENLLSEMSRDIPGFELRSKQNHLLWDFLSKVMFWNPEIATSFITTLYPKVWVPTANWGQKNLGLALEVLAHEYVHLRDRKRLGPLFNLLYLAPQLFALTALLSFWNPWFLCALGFLLPWPSPGRAWLEFRGYRMSMAVHYWLYGECLDIGWIVNQFVGANYYWMFPFRDLLYRRFEREFEKIQKEHLTSELKDVKSILEL